MPALIGERYAEIAQWVQALQAQSDQAAVQEVLVGGGAPPAFKGDNRRETLFRSNLIGVRDLLAKIGLQDEVAAAGKDTAFDAFAVFALADQGRISLDEALAYLTSRYPGQKWSGGPFGGQNQAQAHGRAADRAASAGAPGRAELAQTATEDLLGQLLGPAPGANVGGVPITLDELPDKYDGARVRQGLQGAIEQLQANDAALATGQGLRLEPATLHGEVIVPGSLPATAINPLDFQRILNQLPGPELAVELRVARSSDIDRWIVNAGERGPGRVWQVTSTVYPSGFRPSPAAARYRVVFPGLEFGMLAFELAGGPDFAGTWVPQFQISYGLVLRGLPHFFQRDPVGIVAVGWRDTAPSSFAFGSDDHGLGNLLGLQRLYFNRADANYRTNTFARLVAYGSDPNSVPSATEIGDCQGFRFNLIHGRDGEAVYRQLNSRHCNTGATLRVDGPGPHASLPLGLAPRSPAPSSVYEWNNVGGGGAAHTCLAQATAIGGKVRLSQGVPFSYEDCDRLRLTPGKFSVVVAPAVFHRFAVAGGLSWAPPEAWHRDGVKTTLVSGREWAIDLIVF